MVRIEDLEVYRDDNPLISNLSCTIEPGSLLQVHGKNGIGKSTLLRSIVGLYNNYSGKIFCAANDCHYVGHKLGLNEHLTVHENFFYFKNLYGSGNLNLEILTELGLSAVKNININKLSFGLKQRVNLSRIILAKRNIWVLDEPFTGLDEDAQAIFLNIFVNHLNLGGIIIVATHQTLNLDSKFIKLLSLEDYRVLR